MDSSVHVVSQSSMGLTGGTWRMPELVVLVCTLCIIVLCCGMTTLFPRRSRRSRSDESILRILGGRVLCQMCSSTAVVFAPPHGEADRRKSSSSWSRFGCRHSCSVDEQ